MLFRSTMALGYAYPNPTIEVDGCLVPGGRVYLTAVGGAPNAQYSWNVSAASDESAISDGTSLNNSRVYFNVAAKGPSAQYPIYLTTTNSCSSDNIVTKNIDVTASFYISYQTKKGKKTEINVVMDTEDERYYDTELSVYRYASDGSLVFIKNVDGNNVNVMSSIVGVGEDIFFILRIMWEDGCEERYGGVITVPSIPDQLYYLYKSELTNTTNGTNKVLRANKTDNETKSAYPNPTDGIFSVQLSDVGEYELRVYNINGSLVKSFKGDGDVATADVSELPAGSYTYSVSQGENVTSGVIIKK